MALVIYDLDDTLLNEDCSRLWIRYLHDSGQADDSILQEEQRLDALYRQGKLDMRDYLQMQLQPHIGKTLCEATQGLEQFLDEYIEPHFRPAAVANIRQHQARGDQCIVVSASVAFLVAPIARRLGIDHAIGIQIETIKEKITGQPDGVICYREGKITRLQEWLEDREHSLEESWFYSDSQNDLPLLQRVAYPVAVSPDPVLRQHALNRDWPILEWRC
ncbi:HAD family hydrolase [Neptuniibacter halophilus]|uniref:HAD family hydrolase n=1 Tax=Neptuniibacter halophilus TaxID=651666 RepID=UPI0025747A0D|nr:HAD family hydrolase [Neptuniibacter halophilus]